MAFSAIRAPVSYAGKQCEISPVLSSPQAQLGPHLLTFLPSTHHHSCPGQWPTPPTDHCHRPLTLLAGGGARPQAQPCQGAEEEPSALGHLAHSPAFAALMGMGRAHVCLRDKHALRECVPQWARAKFWAWRIPGTGEPVGLPSMGSHRVGHD